MSYLQTNLDAKGCTAFSELREVLETEAELLPLACFSKLVGGKSEQPAKCVEIGSGKESHCLMPPSHLDFTVVSRCKVFCYLQGNL